MPETSTYSLGNVVIIKNDDDTYFQWLARKWRIFHYETCGGHGSVLTCSFCSEATTVRAEVAKLYE